MATARKDRPNRQEEQSPARAALRAGDHLTAHRLAAAALQGSEAGPARTDAQEVLAATTVPPAGLLAGGAVLSIVLILFLLYSFSGS